MNVTILSDSELEIMRAIWEQGGCICLAPLMERLDSMGKKWKANTVLTFLVRLTDKGMLSVDKVGRINQYTALFTESDYMELLNQSFVKKFYGGQAKTLVATLLRQDCLSAEDFKELEAFWKERGEKNE